MPLAALIGYGAPELVLLLGYKPKVEPRNVAIVGVRDLDHEANKLVKDSGVAYVYHARYRRARHARRS